jgi:acyl carrier protein
MTENDAVRAHVVDALLEVAPEIDAGAVAGDVPLQEQLDLDSMDFLTFLEALAERTGVEVPERDYDQVATIDGCVAYLDRQLA